MHTGKNFMMYMHYHEKSREGRDGKLYDGGFILLSSITITFINQQTIIYHFPEQTMNSFKGDGKDSFWAY